MTTAIRKYIVRYEVSRPGTGRVILEDSVHAANYDTAKNFFGKKHGFDNLLEITEEAWRTNAQIRAVQDQRGA
jgi:hypothetical protein